MKRQVMVKPILGPCRCQGCGQMVTRFRPGWRHPDGTYRCPGKPKPTVR